jgi:hypothetical protein
MCNGNAKVQLPALAKFHHMKAFRHDRPTVLVKREIHVDPPNMYATFSELGGRRRGIWTEATRDRKKAG